MRRSAKSWRTKFLGLISRRPVKFNDLHYIWALEPMHLRCRQNLFRAVLRYARHSSSSSSAGFQKPEHTTWPPLRRLKNPTLAQFQSEAFKPQSPYHLASSFNLPASKLWVDPVDSSKINESYFTPYAGTLSLGMEMTLTTSATTLTRSESSLELFLDYMRMIQDVSINASTTRLYIAQASLGYLPDKLRKDVPTPSLVRDAGKGDLYQSSLWMGPCFAARSPLHTDPNPNILVQIAGTKAIRLMPPDSGKEVLAKVTEGIKPEDRRRPSAMLNPTEMIRRSKYVDQVIWREGGGTPDGAFEAILKPGDGIFIPASWWHSTRGIDNDRNINISANWWFR